jgi:predicted transcriptional regulator
MPKVREVTIRESRGKFNIFSSSNKETSKDNYNFDGLNSLRKLLSKEKARILDAIKYKKPGSIYELAKLLKRPFKATFDDVKLLERFGFIQMTKEKVNSRVRHKPIIISDHMIIHIKI